MSRRLGRVGTLAAGLAFGLAAAAAAQEGPQMVAVSADIVEITGSLDTDVGFKWNELLEFGETSIPGLIRVGEFERKTALNATLRALQTEGKAQLLSNPKIITKSGTQARFLVGGEIPYPVVNVQGTGVEPKKFGVQLNVAPTILDDKKDTVHVQIQLAVSEPNFSRAIVVGNTAVPSLNSRETETEVELKTGETIVIGGLKSTSKNTAKSRVPFLGRIPLLGFLFTTNRVIEEQRSLFLFLTVEIIK